jgi:NAD(P)-dependent dehydrogenase (short-subunit alcohol dehydrogenase family)
MTTRKPAGKKSRTLPPQHQPHQPGIETRMHPLPASGMESYVGSGKLRDKVALITGGDSGIGRAVAIAFAKEGADVAIVYLDEHDDARRTRDDVQADGRACLIIPGDVGNENFCRSAVDITLDRFGRLDILVNNAAEQHPQQDIGAITAEQLEQTFRSNVFSMFFMVKAALPHMHPGARIINTTSVTAYRGSPHLLDYSATKGAIVAFTRSLSLALEARGVLVNAVAPGPIWTPLIPSSFDAQHVSEFGADTPMKRPGQPDEVAPCYVFLAGAESSYMSGQVLHPNGGEVING